MKITWLGHACFKIESAGCTVILDPYEPGSVPGLAPVKETADLVLCSHEHFDHNGRSSVTLTGKACDTLTVETIATYHDDAKGALRGTNTIHIISDGTCRVAHLGDLGCELTPDQLAQLREVNVLMIPVGGFFTIDAPQAAALVKAIEPKIVIPMHYRSERFGFDKIAPVSDFVNRMSSVAMLGGTSSVSVHEIPPAQVLVLKPENLE